LTTTWKGSSNGVRDGKESQVDVPEEFDHDAAQALGKLVEQVIAVPSRRREFRADPITTAQNAGVKVDDKTERVILTLAGLSASELGLLSELNQTLIKEGLYVETGNPPLMVF
jgi:hypothetical protein